MPAFTVGTTGSAGIPRSGWTALNRIVGFGYSQTALERFLSEFAQRIAAVIVTPEPAWLGAENYRRMSDACARHGVLLILDEVITALRYGPRGLNGTGQVPADLITISKGLANGHALAAVLGRRDVIDCYDAAGVAGTYTREVPPMAAALATLDLVADGSVHEHCERMGRLLMEGMRDVLATVGIPALISGPPMMFDLVAPSEQLAWDIYRAAYDYGAWFEDSGTHMVTAAFGEAEVEHALSAFKQGARRVAATADAVGGELPQSRKDQFAAEAFGGRLRDDDQLLSDIEQTLCQIDGERG